MEASKAARTATLCHCTTANTTNADFAFHRTTELGAYGNQLHRIGGHEQLARMIRPNPGISTTLPLEVFGSHL